MKNIVLLILLLSAVYAQGCTVCSRCLDCPTAVLADSYVDSIDTLLQNKIDALGYPLHISRNADSQKITYEIDYSSGLNIQLSLSLQDMQIKLLSYSLQDQQTPIDTSKYNKASDGYYLVTDFSNSPQVVSITRFLSQVVKTSMAAFKLTEVALTTSPAVIYRLKYQVLTFAKPLFEMVYLQYMGENSYQLLDSNYSALSQ